jgi:hypothetical protein
VCDHLLVHLSPRGWKHINLTGDYICVDVDQVTKNPDGFQPLRPPSGARAGRRRLAGIDQGFIDERISAI